MPETQPPTSQLDQRLVDLIAENRSGVLHLLRPDRTDPASVANVMLGLETMKTTAEAIRGLVANVGIVADKERIWAETKRIQAETARVVAEKEMIWAQTKDVQAQTERVRAEKS